MNIEIPEMLFRRLQKHATPLVDTVPVVIERLVNFFETAQTPLRSSETARPLHFPSPTQSAEDPAAASFRKSPTRQFDPFDPPKLVHTTVRGTFGAIPFSNWNDLVQISHVEAFRAVKTFEGLRNMTRANIRLGPVQGQGFRLVPEIGISIQGVDADRAWNHSLRLATHLELPIEAFVEWRQKEGAAHPGGRGVLAWQPANEDRSNWTQISQVGLARAYSDSEPEYTIEDIKR